MSTIWQFKLFSKTINYHRGDEIKYFLFFSLSNYWLLSNEIFFLLVLFGDIRSLFGVNTAKNRNVSIFIISWRYSPTLLMLELWRIKIQEMSKLQYIKTMNRYIHSVNTSIEFLLLWIVHYYFILINSILTKLFN